MKDTVPYCTLLGLLTSAVVSCARPVPVPVEDVPQLSARYLFAGTEDEDREDSDLLVVVDLARQGNRYGTIVATAPVGERGVWPHHTEHEFAAHSRSLFASGFAANRNFVFDLRDPLRPTVTARFDSAAGLALLHSLKRLLYGHVLATFQARGPDNVSPGGIAELDERGRVIRSRSAADPLADQATWRPYSLAAVPSLDRVVVALTYMPIPSWHSIRGSVAHDHAGNQVQVYRLSDLMAHASSSSTNPARRPSVACGCFGWIGEAGSSRSMPLFETRVRAGLDCRSSGPTGRTGGRGPRFRTAPCLDGNRRSSCEPDAARCVHLVRLIAFGERSA